MTLNVPRRDCGTKVAIKPWARRWFAAACAFPNPGVPAPRRDESYSAYLRRIPSRDGLAAEQSFAMTATLGALEGFMDDEYDAYHPVCLEDLMSSREACGAAWAAIATTLFGRGPRTAVLGEHIAAATCAGNANHATGHGEARAALRGLVRANDAALFGGRLAAVQRRVGCGGGWPD